MSGVPSEQALAALSLEEIWPTAASGLGDCSPQVLSVLREYWFLGAYAALEVAQQCCRAAPAVRDAQLARLKTECFQVAKDQAAPSDVH